MPRKFIRSLWEHGADAGCWTCPNFKGLDIHWATFRREGEFTDSTVWSKSRGQCGKINYWQAAALQHDKLHDLVNGEQSISSCCQQEYWIFHCIHRRRSLSLSVHLQRRTIDHKGSNYLPSTRSILKGSEINRQVIPVTPPLFIYAKDNSFILIHRLSRFNTFSTVPTMKSVCPLLQHPGTLNLGGKTPEIGTRTAAPTSLTASTTFSAPPSLEITLFGHR